jgi:5-methylcytosine-specific restriction endonuclease McrA
VVARTHPSHTGQVRSIRSRQKKAAKSYLIRRDGPICQFCRQHFSRGGLTIDHIVPRSAGGLDCGDNMRLLCRPCHDKRHKETA